MTKRYDTETIGFLISDVARLLRSEFDRRTSDIGMGLTPGDARALSAVARAGTMRQATLADMMGIEAMTLSTYLDRLEGRGLVARSPDPTDRRAKLVSITQDAHAVLDEIARVSDGLRGDMGGSLTPAQLEELRVMMRQIRSNLVAMRPECAKGSSAA